MTHFFAVVIFYRKDWRGQHDVPVRRHELRSPGVRHLLCPGEQRAHAGGDIQRTGEEINGSFPRDLNVVQRSAAAARP